jgi:hypothetical protein
LVAGGVPSHSANHVIVRLQEGLFRHGPDRPLTTSLLQMERVRAFIKVRTWSTHSQVALTAWRVVHQALDFMGNFFLAASGEARIQLYVTFLQAADASLRSLGLSLVLQPHHAHKL